ncbi:MAG: hypothetical protein ACLP01_01125 [Solirubrobacteraceae bacterium]
MAAALAGALLAGGASPAAAANPPGTVTLGSTSGTPSANPCLSMIPCTYVPFSNAEVPELQVPATGTVTSFSVNTGSSGGIVELRVLTPGSGGAFTGAGTGPSETLATTGVNTFTVSIPVKAGDVLGLDNATSALIFATVGAPAFTAYYEEPSLADGKTAVPNQDAAGDQPLLSATVKLTPASVNSFSSSCSGTLPSTGGSCTLQWTLSNTSTCTLSSSPDLLGGTQSTGCADSATNTNQVSFPQNTGTTPVSYTFTLTATGASGTTPASRTTTVTVQPFRPTPPPPLSASIVKAATVGDQLLLTIACRNGSATATCSGPVTVTSHVTTQAGKPIEVAARAARPARGKAKPAPKTTSAVQVASASYSTATGTTATATLTLNATGKRLLNRFYTLPATVTIGGTTALTTRVSFSYARITSFIEFDVQYGPASSFARQLSIVGLPSKASVAVICRGGGCPFAHRTFSPHGSTLVLSSAFAHSHLAPGSTIELEITAANHIGKVGLLRIRGGQPPTFSTLCLPPGAPAPLACV